ncbi:MAG: ATP-binding protein [Polyangiaceae bacterium]|nr:ATP-binding protein [Polyangiaceae bacterium]MCB9606024.1 ATP-binding protein [Polyangiaceae bacterium]
MAVSLERTRVDLGGLMRVLGEHLYSSPSVAVRELVQNAHDSIERRRIEDPDGFATSEPSIRVECDAENGRISIEDTGAGLTKDEIVEYLATVGTGYTRRLRDASADAGLIGYFGLGFLTAFVVAERTEVWTCSYQDPDQAFLFHSKNGQQYGVEAAEKRPVGTRVTLELRERFRELSDPHVLSALVRRYCGFLSYPVRIHGEHVNERPPAWRDAELTNPIRKKRALLELAERFGIAFEPLCAIEVDGEACKGVIWIHAGSTYGTSDHRDVHVFIRGMLIGDEDRELLPSWAGFASAVIESVALHPTASRETLQKDAVYEQVKGELREALIDGLGRIAQSEAATWRRVLLRHNEALLGSALSDPRLFGLLAEDVTLPTSHGDLRVKHILDKSQGKLHVSQTESGGFEELLFRALGVPVVHGIRFAALPFCKAYTDRVRGRLVLLGTGKGDSELFQKVELSTEEQSKLEGWFGRDDVAVMSCRFAPRELPFVLVPDREIQLKRRIESDQADARISSAVLGLARQFTAQVGARPSLRLYVNCDCPAIVRLLAAPPERAARGVRLLAPLVSLLSETGEETRLFDVETALRDFCAALCETLDA